MSLDFTVDTLDGLSEGIRDLYAKHDDGKFYLDVTGAVAKSRLDEFRDNNVKLLKEKDALEARFKDIDPQKYAELLAKSKELEGKESITKAEMEDLVRDRIANTVAEYKDSIAALEKDKEGLTGQLAEALIDNQVRMLGIKYGVREFADTDLVNRARTTFSLNEQNVPVAKDSKGGVIYGKDGQNPLTIEEWMQGQKEKDGTHLFTKSSGSGASGSNSGGTRRIDASNMTPLQKIAHGMSGGN